jgi:hypothetical protein
MDAEKKDEEGDKLGKMVEATKTLTEKVWRATKESVCAWTRATLDIPSTFPERSTVNLGICRPPDVWSGHRGHRDVDAIE